MPTPTTPSRASNDSPADVVAGGIAHTPGPWDVNIWTSGRRTIESRRGQVCELNPIHGDGFRANSRLIAAAPDMHAALLRARAVLCGDALSKGELIKALEACNAALAKAVAP